MRRRIGTPKLTPPTLAGALARPRLFALLDAAAPVVWMSGPAGAGKTTLMATYAAARALDPVWYQFDLTDGDPGTLFHYLKDTLPSRRSRLPAFVERYSAGPDVFAQRYFRQYFHQAGDRGVVLVLDGAERAPSHPLLEQAAYEVPAHSRLVILSRDPPPAALARLEMQARLTHLGWEQLRFSESETAALVQQEVGEFDARTRRVDGAALHAHCGGWAAGLRLMLEQIKRNGPSMDGQPTGPNDTLFRFIASEVFDGLPEPQRAVLLRLCLLPEIPAQEVVPLTSG